MFVDWLKDIWRICIKTINKNSYWEEIETEEIKFDNFQCRKWIWKFRNIEASNKARFVYIETFKLYTLLEQWNIERWNYIYLNGDFEKKFLIIWWQEAKWGESNHYVYMIVEYEQYIASN